MYKVVTHFQENYKSINDCKLKSRYLWNDHIIWRRNAIISIPAGIADVDAVSERLLQNQDDIGNFIRPYYSNDNVDQYVNLLKEHIAIAAQIIKGSDDPVKLEAQWRANGEDIVNLMENMNPYFWPKSVTGPLWIQHLNLTLDQVSARSESRWTDDITAFDSNHKCINDFADIFSRGLIYQNIEYFSKPML